MMMFGAGGGPMAFGGIRPQAVAAPMQMASGMEVPTSTNTEPLKEVGRVRNVFPETWLWTNSSVG